jgi:hypothetical protein
LCDADEVTSLSQRQTRNQPVEKLGKAGKEKISERVRVKTTVVLLTGASRWKSASSCISAINPVELLVRSNEEG